MISHIKIHRNNILNIKNIKINNMQNIKAKFFFWYHFMSRLFLILPFSCEMRLEDFTLLKIKSGAAFPKTTTALPEIFEFVFSCKGESLFQAYISMKKNTWCNILKLLYVSSIMIIKPQVSYFELSDILQLLFHMCFI